jgi:hypothetical protein
LTAVDVTTTGNTILGNASTDTLNVGNGDLIKDASGNVGIGTASPSSKLHIDSGSTSVVIVNSTSSFGPLISLQKSGTAFGAISAYSAIAGSGTDYTPTIFAETGLGIRFAVNGDATKAMTLDASGNLGIGTTPSAWYSLSKVVQVGVGGAIEGRSNYYPYLALTSNVYLNSAGEYKTLSTDLSTRYLATAGVHTWYNSPSTTAGTTATFTQAMTLDASGNLLVGTASATAGGTAGTIQNVSSSNYHYVARNSGATAGKYRYMGVDSSNTLLVYNNSNAGMYMADGGTAWVANSDERLKTDLLPIENAIEKVSTLRAVTGRYKSDAVGISRSFVIAQDVLAVLPEAVTKNASIANDDIEYLGVAYSDLIPLLIAGFKEQQALITALTTRITALEGAAA